MSDRNEQNRPEEELQAEAQEQPGVQEQPEVPEQPEAQEQSGEPKQPKARKRPKKKKKKSVSLAASFRTRSFRVGSYSVAMTAIVIAIAVAVNLLFAALPAGWTQFDTTSNQLFTISDQTESLVSDLETDVTIYWIVQSGQEDSTLDALLDQYTSLSSHVKVVKRDPDVYPTFLSSYDVSTVYNNSLIVESGERYRYVDYYDIFVLDYTSYYYYGTTDWSFYGEQEITSAIDYVISEDLPKVYTLTGHGESTMSDTFSSAVEAENIEVEELSLLTVETVPTDADCVLIYAPQTDISSDELAKLQEYLGNGGSILLITDPPEDGALTNLESLTAAYGVTAEEGIVIEASQSNYAWGTPYYLLPDINSHTVTSPLIEGGYYVLLPIAQGLTVSSDLASTVSVTELLTTSSSSFSKIAGYSLTTYEKEDGDISGPFALAVEIEETLDDDLTSNIIWVSSSSLLDDQCNEMVSGGNQDLFLNMLSYLCGSEGSSISIHAKSLSSEYLTMDSATSGIFTALIVGVIPAAYLAVGLVVWYRRRRR